MGQPSDDFSDRVVVVTGGSAGLGAGIVSAFVAAGARVVTCGTTPDDVAGAVFVTADVRQADQARQVIHTASERFGRVDVLVNSAGGWPEAGPDLAAARPMEAIVALNLLAPFYCAQAAHDFMVLQPNGGVIVNVAQVSDPEKSAEGAAFDAARAGLVNLTSTLAVEWAPKVRVNFVGAGDLAADEVAQACLFLAGPASGSITGANLLVHGGSAAVDGGDQPASC
jgi:NAD(P)-dependent dehydrogenase (short-subunit alcohol dehydrogenase family)